jgi:hypothetical protein
VPRDQLWLRRPQSTWSILSIAKIHFAVSGRVANSLDMPPASNNETRTPQHFRERAQDFRKMAADEPEDLIRVQLLKLADAYDELAALMEKESR